MATKDEISKELEAADVSGEDTDDDYFDKVLEQEMELPTDDDEDADTSKEKDTSRGESEEGEPAEKESLESLKEKLDAVLKEKEELEKAAKGRLNDTVKSRQEKAQIKAELDELKSAVSSLLAKRDDALKKELEEEEEKTIADLKRKNIQFDDDDKAFVDLSDVEKRIETETKQTKEELAALKAEREAEKAEIALKSTINGIISEDQEAFRPAMSVLTKAYEDLNNSVIALQERLGIMDEDGSIDQDQALDLLQGTEELKEFTEKHPGIDPIKIARAFNSKVDFRTSLRSIADIKSFGKKEDEDIEAKLNEKIKKAKDKPGSLAKSENQAGGNANLIDRIAEMDSDSILNLSDSEAAKIEAMLEREALKEL